MDIDEAYQHVIRSFTPDVGKFYSTGANVGLGKGKLYKAVRFPIYVEGDLIFQTAKGNVYVMTHECDVDAENERIFNTEVLVCPIIALADLVAECQELVSKDYLVSFLTNLGSRNVARLVYLPPCPPLLTHGGALYLNHISSTDISAFILEDAEPVAMLTAYGLRVVEQMIENHLLRPKADPVALSR